MATDDPDELLGNPAELLLNSGVAIELFDDRAVETPDVTASVPLLANDDVPLDEPGADVPDTELPLCGAVTALVTPITVSPGAGVIVKGTPVGATKVVTP